MRSLAEIANATPADYLTHAPSNPTLVAMRMLQKAQALFPKNPNALFDPSYSFLYVGAGSGFVVNELLNQEQNARGLETSKRGIMASPPGSISYIAWCLPWETPYASMTGGANGQSPKAYKQFHVTLISSYLETLLEPDEWQATKKEIKKLSQFSAIIKT